MEYLLKLERIMLGWFKPAPHMPEEARKWLGANIWWIVVIGVVLSGMVIIGLILTLLGSLLIVGPLIAYFASPGLALLKIVQTIVVAAFVIAQFLVLLAAIKPLKEKQKNGWTLLFVALLLGAASTVVTAVLTLNVFSFIANVIFGAVWAAFCAYLLFEIHGQFTRVERSKGVKNSKA